VNGVRPVPESLDREIADVERRRLAVEHLLDDELRRRGRVHESVAGEARGDVQTRRTRDRADDGMVVRRHLVVAGPAIGDREVGERLHAPRRADPEPRLELRRDARGVGQRRVE